MCVNYCVHTTLFNLVWSKWINLYSNSRDYLNDKETGLSLTYQLYSQINFKQHFTLWDSYNNQTWWGCSSSGRALASHARGMGIDTPLLQCIKQKYYYSKIILLLSIPLIWYSAYLICVWIRMLIPLFSISFYTIDLVYFLTQDISLTITKQDLV